MKLLVFWSNVVLSVFMLIFPTSAFADSYQIFNLGNADSNSVYGIDTAGDVVIRGATGCGDLFYCYKTYTDGMESSVSAAAPILDYDNGTACMPAVGADKAACDNGYEAFGLNHQVFAGTDGAASYLYSGTVDAIALNSAGDFAWTDGRDEYNFEAIDLTTDRPASLSADLSPRPVPEPGSLLLLATGALGGAATLRRRLALQS